MIQHPAILALSIASLLTCFMLVYAAWYGTRILEKWDLHSGSELQLELERRTYLISVILSYTLVFQLIPPVPPGLHCRQPQPPVHRGHVRSRTLQCNGFGYPLLLLKFVNFLLAGLWLIMNHADNRGVRLPPRQKEIRLPHGHRAAAGAGDGASARPVF